MKESKRSLGGAEGVTQDRIKMRSSFLGFASAAPRLQCSSIFSLRGSLGGAKGVTQDRIKMGSSFLGFASAPPRLQCSPIFSLLRRSLGGAEGVTQDRIKMRPSIPLFFSLFLFFTSTWAKPIELIFWHSMAGDIGKQMQAVVDGFNQSQKGYFIKTVYKGDYVETLTSFAAAFRAHQAPAIVQVFEVGSGIMLAPEGVIKPVDDLMQEEGMTLPKQDFIQSVREFYSKENKLMAMPFNLSAPVLYYNADALAKIAYKEPFPQTWEGMEVLAEKLTKVGYDCAYTTAFPAWVLVESYSSIHGLKKISELQYHFQRLVRWNDHHYFRYGGRASDATILFTSGVCPLFSQSSGAYHSLKSMVPFKLGVAPMPLDTAISPVRHANVAGGAALWVTAGQKKNKYKGIALFFAYLAQPKVQKAWHEHTGYLPIGLKGIYAELVKTSHHPTLLLAKNDLEEKNFENAVSHQDPQYQIRAINDEVLEAMFAGLFSSKESIKQATIRTDHIIARFAKNTHQKSAPHV